MFSLCRLVARQSQAASVSASATSRFSLIRNLHATTPTSYAEMKRRPLPTTTSIKYTIPTDPFLLAKKFQQVSGQGKLDDAVAIVMQSKSKSQSSIVWNLVIDAYAKTGRLSRALRAFTEMRRRGFKPTPTTFTAIFKACALSDSENSLEIAQDAYDSMERHGVKPTIISVNSLLSVYLRKHNVEAMLSKFNDLPQEGPLAPSLATYTMLLSALRRELQLKLDDLKAKPEKPTDVIDKDNEFVYRRRVALKKEHVHDAFSALINTWSAFADDAVHRIDSRPAETSLLGIDAHIVNIVLKACHSVYSENRALGRKGLRVAEQVYGLDQLDKTQQTPAKQKNASGSNSLVPLATRIRQNAPEPDSDAANAQKDGLGQVVDDTTVGLVLDLCMRDDQPTKAVRFWRSIETNFEPMFTPSQETVQKYQTTLSAHKHRSNQVKE
ncbi:hypothetical protein LPJ57_000492 [Coemansia sp. RSA 486]|nr:hypothetical protein LPJ57_000492 [Coemansia sp. RSA 486]